MLDFAPPLPLFITRAFPSRTTLAGVFASDLVFFGSGWRVERAVALLAVGASEGRVVGVGMERGSSVDVGSTASGVP